MPPAARQTSRTYGKNNTYQDSRFGQLLLSHIDILCKDNERMKVVNQKLLAKFGKEKAQVVVYKEAIITCSGGVDIIQRQPEDLSWAPKQLD